jgi:hypothetical protein
LRVLDIASSNHGMREQWLDVLKLMKSKEIDKWRHSHSSLKWAIRRNVRLNSTRVDRDRREIVSDETFGVASNNSIWRQLSATLHG